MKWIIFALVCIILGMILKGINPFFATCIGMAGALCLALYGASQMKELILRMTESSSAMGQAGTFFPLLVKILGIAYLCELAAVLSKEAGFLSLSLQIEILGKLAVMLCAMPLVFSVLDQIAALMKS